MIVLLVIVGILISITLSIFLAIKYEQQQENEVVRLSKNIKLKYLKPTILEKGTVTKIINDDPENINFDVQFNNGKTINFSSDSDQGSQLHSYNADIDTVDLDTAEFDGKFPLFVGEHLEFFHKNAKIVGNIKEFNNISFHAQNQAFMNHTKDDFSGWGLYLVHDAGDVNGNKIANAYYLTSDYYKKDETVYIKPIK